MDEIDYLGVGFMQRRWFISFILISFVLTIIIFFINVKLHIMSEAEVSTASIKTEEINDFLILETETKETKDFHSSITTPKTSLQKIDEKVEKWKQIEKQLFINYLREHNPNEEKPVQFVIESEIIEVNKDLFNYLLKVKYIINDDLRVKKTKTFTIDYKQKDIITLDDLLKINYDDSDDIKQEILQLIPVDQLKGDIINMDPTMFNDLRWIAQKNSLILYFSTKENQIENLQTVKIPYKNLTNKLNKPYKTMLLQKKNKKKKTKKNITNNKLIALTFDDGPIDNVTPKILQLLKDEDIKATFFMIGTNVEKYPKIARKVAADGHEIANHSYSHANLNKLNKTNMKQQLIHSQKIIEQITNYKPKLFRPPYGEYNETVINLAEESKQEIIMWSVDSYDWKAKNKNTILDNTLKDLKPGSIILMHDIHEVTAESLPSLIKKLKSDNYEFVTVSELIKTIDTAPNGVYYGN